jgi:hypothetical protein
VHFSFLASVVIVLVSVVIVLASVVIVLFQAGEAYSYLDVTKVKDNNTNLSTVGKEHVSARVSPNILSD